MALNPIDLQTLYSQLENVSKNIASQQQVAQLRNSVQQETYGKKINEKEKAVRETARENEDTILVKERNERRQDGSSRKRRESEENVPEQKDEGPVLDRVTEPGLGRYIDVQG